MTALCSLCRILLLVAAKPPCPLWLIFSYLQFAAVFASRATPRYNKHDRFVLIGGNSVPDELLPAAEMAAPVPDHLDPAQRVQLWLQLMGACDALLRAGLVHEHGSDEHHIREAYRQWYDQGRLEHDAVIRRMARRLQENQDDAA